MAATIELYEYNGASPTETLVSSLNLGNVDSPNLASVDALLSLGHFSFEKWLRLKITDLGGANTLDNFKVWISDGELKDGESIKTNLNTSYRIYSASSFPVAGPSSEESDVALYDMPEVEPQQANLGIDGELSGSVTSETTLPVFTDYIVLQLGIANTASLGFLNTKVITFQWDEQ